MHQGKHQEYEKRLHDALIAQMQQQSQQPTIGSGNPATTSPVVGTVLSGNGNSGNGIMKSSSAESKELTAGGGNGTVTNGQIQKEAWPSLSTSPVTIKENKTSVKGSELLCKYYSLTVFFNHHYLRHCFAALLYIIHITSE